jgi:hypothetical protein
MSKPALCATNGASPTNAYNSSATAPNNRLSAKNSAVSPIACKGRDYMDWKGQHFFDLKAAKAHAAKIARKLAQNGSLYVGGSVCIADEHGEELH